MHKLWTMVRKEVYVTYTNRNLVLVMILTPLALAAVIGIALSGVNRGNTHVPVAIVNLDQTTASGINYGQVFVSALVPNASPNDTNAAMATCGMGNPQSTNVSLFDLTDAVQLNDAEMARQAVDQGKYAAAIIIPPDFSAKIGYSPTHPQIDPVAVEVYADSGQPNSAQMIRAIVERITDQINAGNIAIAASVSSLQQRFGAQFLQASTRQGFGAGFACGFSPAFNPVTIERQTAAGAPAMLDFFVYMSCGQAVFWVMFTAFRGATDILNERQQGTLPRLVVMAVRPTALLAGKLIGTFINCLLQLALLFVAFTVVRSLTNGAFRWIWGNDFVSIGLLMVAVSLSAAGLGTLAMSLTPTAEQAMALAGLLATFLGALGGVFFPVRGVPILEQLAVVSPTYWGSDAFYRLAVGQGGIIPHLIILVLLGGVTFSAGVWLFVRRLGD
jgi:ABC-type Na+ efflux pump permease subunit